MNSDATKQEHDIFLCPIRRKTTSHDYELLTTSNVLLLFVLFDDFSAQFSIPHGIEFLLLDFFSSRDAIADGLPIYSDKVAHASINPLFFFDNDI